jgi:hypothetical protein
MSINATGSQGLDKLTDIEFKLVVAVVCLAVFALGVIVGIGVFV